MRRVFHMALLAFLAYGLAAFAARAADPAASQSQAVDDFKTPALDARWKCATLLAADGGDVAYDYATGDGQLAIRVRTFKPKARQDALLCTGVTLEPGKMFIVDIADFKPGGPFDTAGPVLTVGTAVSNRSNLISMCANAGLANLTAAYADGQEQFTSSAQRDLPGKLTALFIARLLPNLYSVGYQLADGPPVVLRSFLLPAGAPEPSTVGFWTDLRGVGASATFRHARITAAPGAGLVLPGMFSDHMVLQREKPVPVWGWARPGAACAVSFAGQTKTAAAGPDGRWAVTLDPLALSAQGREMQITVNGTAALAFKDVLVGDVWLCSGQSNMELPLAGIKFKNRLHEADFPATIRWLDVPNQCSKTPQLLYGGKGWARVADRKHNFSAVAYYFARKIHQETGVPLGMLEADWGGTRIETWTPPCGYDLTPALAAEVRKQAEAVAAAPAINFYHGIHVNYNGMLRPLAPYAIKGAIWYQGESNADMADTQSAYLEKMRALVGGWRKIWAEGDFPFYYVQLPNLGKPVEDPAGGDLKWPLIREAQRQALAIPNTGMAVAVDVGSEGTIHPLNKMDVGERLALWALAKDYGRKDLVCSGPLYKSQKIEGNKIRIAFDSVGGGLMAGTKGGDYAEAPVQEVAGGKLQQFAIAGADKKWHWAEATIEGATVVVSSKDVPNPVAVRYAFSISPKGCNLYNRENLPAAPFRTDEW